MSEAVTAQAAAPLLAPQAHILPLPLDLPSRADSGTSVLSLDSTSGNSSEQAAGSGGSCPLSLGLAPRASSGSGELDHGISAGGSSEGCALGPGSIPKKDVDARSSALKALAGVSAIVSKSRKVDAEALQAIKSQRAKARAEGHVPSPLTTASSVPAPGPGGGAGRATPPPPAPLGSSGGDGAAGLSPFATATSQGLVRTPSGSNLNAMLGGSGGQQPQGSGLSQLSQASSLPISMHSQQQQQQRRRPTSGHSASPPESEYDALVSKMTITELVALKQAVEGQLAKQALALAQLQASTQHNAQTDMLSQQYAALLLQNAQQAQLVQQLSSAQQAAHAAAIHQALTATATAAGITSASFSPEQLLLSAGGPGSGGVSSYPSLPLPDMSSPFASAAYPPEAGFGMADAGPRASVPLQAQRTFTAGGTAIGSKSSGSPRSASAEQQLIGEALHSFVDPERQGPPSRQGSALVNGINWSDRRSLAPMGSGAPGGNGGGSGGTSFSRSRSLPHPQDGLYPDRSASLNQYLGDGSEHPHLPSLFNSLRLAESLSAQQAQQVAQHVAQQVQQAQQAAAEGGMPPSAFASARSGNMQVPLTRGGPGGPGGLGAMSPPHVVFADSVQTRTFQPTY